MRTSEGIAMSNRLRALVGLTYPHPDSLDMVKQAGGISKLSEEQRKKLKMVDRKAGQFCDDMPKSSIKSQLKQKNVEIVEGKSSAPDSEDGWTSPKPQRETSKPGRCKAITASGTRCKNKAISGDFCGSHR